MKKAIIFSTLLLFVFTFFLTAQTPPEKFLGHQVGADKKLADYNQILAYFKKLDEESNKIKVLTIGKTTRNKPIIMAVITTEENKAQLDKYKKIAGQLRDAEGLTPEQAKSLAKEASLPKMRQKE